MRDSIGIDFGTTNTVIAKANAGNISAVTYSGGIDTLRTALCFANGRNGVAVQAGNLAIQQFIDDPWDTRFLQSFKTFAASSLFSSTAIFTKRYTFEDLLESFLACAYRDADAQLVPPPSHVVMGRPVIFAGA